MVTRMSTMSWRLPDYSLSLVSRSAVVSRLFFFNDTATTEIYTLSLHDALPIFTAVSRHGPRIRESERQQRSPFHKALCCARNRSEEHTSELQSQSNLVCRLLLEKKN